MGKVNISARLFVSLQPSNSGGSISLRVFFSDFKSLFQFQNLLPSSVCGQLVADVLEKTAEMPKLRDRALQFLNTKLLQDNSYLASMDAKQLNSLIMKFNSWLQPADGKIDVSI